MEAELSEEDIEIEALLEVIFLKWGYDLRGYARASLKRRVLQFVQQEGYKRLTDLQYDVLRDRGLFTNLIQGITVNVSEFFRDPCFYRELRNQVIPKLKTYPHIKVWHAGCATGEEVYSVAITLREAGLLDRTTIYATDINSAVLEFSKKGIYPDSLLRDFESGYVEGGGEYSLSDYYTKGYDHFKIDPTLANNVVFTEHDLVTDHSFGEMNLVICRNVLIYFRRDLQERVLDLFHESLDLGGFLCLGIKERVEFYKNRDVFKTIDEETKIFQKNISATIPL